MAAKELKKRKDGGVSFYFLCSRHCPPSESRISARTFSRSAEKYWRALDAALDEKRQKDGGKHIRIGHFSAAIFLPSFLSFRTRLLARKLTVPFPFFRPCVAKTWRCTPMDPRVTQLGVDAFDAVKNAAGSHQNVQKYGLTPLIIQLAACPDGTGLGGGIDLRGGGTTTCGILYPLSELANFPILHKYATELLIVA